jgi:hypothetical protein
MGKYLNIDKVTQLSIGILFMYMAFNSSSNIQSEIMEEDGFGPIGFYILGVLYFFMGMGAIMSSAIKKKFGTKFCLVLGGVGNCVWILSSILASEK